MPVIDDEFYRDCWSHWSDTCNLDFVVQNKMPIPYFGDVGAYMQSEPRVITVALNPNLDVFPCTRCNGVLEPKETERRLSVYFREREIAGDLPRWFSSYKHVLEGAGYSYLGPDNVALHADLCSPIATDPTWGALTPKQRSTLLEPGRRIFSALCERLQPNLIFVSLSRDEVAHQWSDPRGGEWQTLVIFAERENGAPRIPPYEVRYTVIDCGDERRTMIVFGPPMQGRPFGGISPKQRRAVGRQAMEVLTNI